MAAAVAERTHSRAQVDTRERTRIMFLSSLGNSSVLVGTEKVDRGGRKISQMSLDGYPVVYIIIVCEPPSKRRGRRGNTHCCPNNAEESHEIFRGDFNGRPGHIG